MESLAVIKDLLPHGAQKEIALRINTTQLEVNRVLNGRTEDFIIMEAIADYYAEYKERKRKISERLTSLV